MSVIAACAVCETANPLGMSAVWVHCEGCQSMVFHPADGPRVLIGHDSETICADVGTLLHGQGFHVIRAKDGMQAMRLIERHRPHAACLDVALGPVSSPQIIEAVRAQPDTANIRVILIASVYNKSAYKRPPTKLYGADGYVELHSASELPAKLGALLGYSPKAPPPPTGFAGVPTLNQVLRVRALAQSIVADIVLSNQQAVTSWVGSATAEPLKAALDDGRRLLAEMAKREEYDSADPVGEAFEAFVDEMRRIQSRLRP